MVNQENYKTYTIEDFVWDEQFRNWILTADEELALFWTNWLMHNADKEEVVLAAREIVLSLKVKDITITDLEIQEVIKSTVNEITEREESKRRGLNLRTIMWPAVAASVILAVGISLLFWFNQKPVLVPASVRYNELVKSSSDRLIKKVNKSDKSLAVKLEDGTEIVLERGAKISYASSFIATQKREVYLSGEASFNVTKDPQKPFFVYANGLVTKVLGTEFKIRSYESEKKVTVEVTSGVVSVFPFINESSGNELKNQKVSGLILSRNQKAIYSTKDHSLIASVIEKPVLKKDFKINYHFVHITVDSVFTAIEKGYGIDIIYDEKAFSDQTLTANLTNSSMYQMLHVICKATNAQYEVIDGKVVIHNDNLKRMPGE